MFELLRFSEAVLQLLLLPDASLGVAVGSPTSFGIERIRVLLHDSIAGGQLAEFPSLSALLWRRGQPLVDGTWIEINRHGDWVVTVRTHATAVDRDDVVAVNDDDLLVYVAMPSSRLDHGTDVEPGGSFAGLTLRFERRPVAADAHPSSTETFPVVLIVGGGFCAVAVAGAILRRCPTRKIIILSPETLQGLGVAYGARDPSLLLNVPVSRMALETTEPDAFLRFCAEIGLEVGTNELVGRRLFGHFILNQFNKSLAAFPGRVKHYRSRAISCREHTGTWLVGLEDGHTLRAEDVVLATGHGPPNVPNALRPLRGNSALSDSLEIESAVSRLQIRDNVALIGTGLTAIDAVCLLHRRGHLGNIFALSHRGLWPMPHLDPQQTCKSVSIPPAPIDPDVSKLIEWASAAFAAAAADGTPWQAVVDAIRAQVPAIWRALAPVERDRFMRELRANWEVLRHRAPTSTSTIVRRMSETGQLTTRAGVITEAHLCEPDDAHPNRTLNSRQRVRLVTDGADGWHELNVDAVILCTGAIACVTDFGDPLWNDLLARQYARADQLGLGIESDESGRVLGARGHTPGLWAVGAITRPCHYESTSVPDLSGLCVQLAEALIRRPLRAEGVEESSPDYLH